MTAVTLYTKDGREVVTVPIPPFLEMPEAIAWGERVFVRRPDGEYREGLLWIVPPDVVRASILRQ